MNTDYPSPDQIELPEPDEISPDQSYYLGWLVQHNRLWLAVVGLSLLALVSIGLNVLQASKYTPTIEYVTLRGGYPVVWNERGNPVIDDTEYVPARLRTVVRTFIENRYEYDWQNPQKINTALRLMSSEAREAERQKLEQLNLRNTIIAPQVKVDLVLDYTNWEVVAQGEGRFEVTVEGEARITDALRNPDRRAPRTQPVSLELVVQTVPATDVNPLGYVIVSTGRDIL